MGKKMTIVIACICIGLLSGGLTYYFYFYDSVLPGADEQDNANKQNGDDEAILFNKVNKNKKGVNED